MPVVRSPDLRSCAHLVTTAPEAGWVQNAAAFLGQPRALVGSRVWPLLLMRGFPFALFVPTGATVEAYRRTWWHAAPPPAAVELRSVVAWSRPGATSTEVAVVTQAHQDNAVVAGNVVVLRVPNAGVDAFGQRDLPPPPVLPSLEREHSFIVRPDEVAHLEELLGSGSQVTDDPGFAHHHGFPSPLTPGLLLLHRAFHRDEDWGPAGTIELWMLQPIPLHSVTEAWRSPDAPGLAALCPIGREQPAVIGRRRNEVAPLAGVLPLGGGEDAREQ